MYNIMKKKHSSKCKPSVYWTFKIMIRWNWTFS